MKSFSAKSTRRRSAASAKARTMTSRKIAPLLNVSYSAVQGYIAKGAPHSVDRRGRMLMNLDEMKAWLVTHGTVGGKHNSKTGGYASGSTDEMPRYEGMTPLEIECRLKLERAKKLELERTERLRELVNAMEVEQLYRQHLQAVRAALENAPLRMLTALLAKTELQIDQNRHGALIERLLQEKLLEIFDSLSETPNIGAPLRKAD